MKRIVLLALLGFVIVGGVAQAQEPFMSGQVKSQALAMQTMRPPCAWVGVSSMSNTDIAADAGVQEDKIYLGIAFEGQCRIGLNPQGISASVRTLYGGNGYSQRFLLREARIYTCTVIVHEYGHLAGLAHSPDPHNVMHAVIEFAYPPCVRLFARSR